MCSARWRERILQTLHSPSWLPVSNRMFWLPCSSPIFGWKCNCTFFLIQKYHSPWAAFQRQCALELMDEWRRPFPISKPHQNPHKWDFPSFRHNQQFRRECNHRVRREQISQRSGNFIPGFSLSWYCCHEVLPWLHRLSWLYGLFQAGRRDSRLFVKMDAAQRERKKKERNGYFPNPVSHKMKQDSSGYQKYT